MEEKWPKASKGSVVGRTLALWFAVLGMASRLCGSTLCGLKQGAQLPWACGLLEPWAQHTALSTGWDGAWYSVSAYWMGAHFVQLHHLTSAIILVTHCLAGRVPGHWIPSAPTPLPRAPWVLYWIAFVTCSVTQCQITWCSTTWYCITWHFITRSCITGSCLTWYCTRSMGRGFLIFRVKGNRLHRCQVLP